MPRRGEGLGRRTRPSPVSLLPGLPGPSPFVGLPLARRIPTVKWFWVKIVLRDGRGRLVGPVAHLPISAPNVGAAVTHEMVVYAEDRLWASVSRAMHGSARLQTVAVEIVAEAADHE